MATSQWKDKQAALYTRQKVRGCWDGARLQRVLGSLCKWLDQGREGGCSSCWGGSRDSQEPHRGQSGRHQFKRTVPYCQPPVFVSNSHAALSDRGLRRDLLLCSLSSRDLLLCRLSSCHLRLSCPLHASGNGSVTLLAQQDSFPITSSQACQACFLLNFISGPVEAKLNFNHL